MAFVPYSSQHQELLPFPLLPHAKWVSAGKPPPLHSGGTVQFYYLRLHDVLMLIHCYYSSMLFFYKVLNMQLLFPMNSY